MCIAVCRVGGLEERIEEEEYCRIVDERLTKGVPEEEWLSEEEFYRTAMDRVKRSASSESEERPERSVGPAKTDGEA